MIEDFLSVDIFPLNVYSIIGNLIIAFICGLIIALSYKFIYKGPSYSSTYVNSLIILAMITALIIMVIGNNLARAFGLVGAMSIIRFRTAVRDVQDIIFIFFALSAGMASGVGLYAIALISTILINLTIILLDTFNFANPRKREYLLQINYLTSDSIEAQLGKILKSHCKRFKLINLKTLRENDNLEAYYHISLKKENNNQKVISEINHLNGINNVSIYFDEDDSNPPTF
ncbi:MAG: DUF4956 domain-containing protein [Hyphomicrobiales bacterium]